MSGAKLRALGWRPRIGLREGLADTYACVPQAERAVSEGERKKGSSKGRAARLEAELRANLKKRKDKRKLAPVRREQRTRWRMQSARRRRRVSASTRPVEWRF